jgi:hypothetical protein
MPQVTHQRHWAICAGIALLLVSGVCAAQERIGSAASLRNRVEGIVGGGLRPLQQGSEVYQDEVVRTGDASVVQLVFLDSTDLRVGPKSEVALDRFVYDPGGSTGSVWVRAALGIFRFVTGSQQKQNYLIRTPVASIGVRGTIFDLLVLPTRVTVILVEGEIDVTTLQGRVVTLSQPGTSVTVFANGFVVGPRVWRGSVHVDYANAQFPYFEPVSQPGHPTNPSGMGTATPPQRSARHPRGEGDTSGYRRYKRREEPPEHYRRSHDHSPSDHRMGHKDWPTRTTKKYPGHGKMGSMGCTGCMGSMGHMGSGGMSHMGGPGGMGYRGGMSPMRGRGMGH